MYFRTSIHNQEEAKTNSANNREGKFNVEPQETSESTGQGNGNEKKCVVKSKVKADDWLDEDEIIKWDFCDQDSRIRKLKQTGYREAILDNYSDQEKAGQVAGWRAGLGNSQSKTNLVQTLSKLTGALMALKVKQSLTTDQDELVREFLKEVEEKIKIASQSDSPHFLDLMKKEIGETFEKEIEKVSRESGLISLADGDGASNQVTTNTTATVNPFQNQSEELEANIISKLHSRVQALYKSCGLDIIL